MNTKQQGDIGVAAAIMYYTEKGFAVSIPMGDATRYDLVVDFNGTLERIQCKATGYKTRHGVPCVGLSTQGGNRTWDGQKKFITEDECDRVFVHVLGGPSYEFPSGYVAGKASLNLGKLQEPYRVTGSWVGIPALAVNE
jgi:hypothetical protein